jgi:AcrR family transcriptional regulator
MPFSRFEKLPSEKRERLFEMAAQEFASRGFEQASLNHILEQAQMGKGSAYYYFEDKADLFGAVIEYARERLHLDDLTIDLAALTAETFWPAVAALSRESLLRSFEQPWLFQVLRVPARLSPALWEREPLASLAQQFKTLVIQMIKRGQELGVIRADVPDDLLFAWLFALDQASDQWLMSHWEQMEREARVAFSDMTVAVISNALAPGASQASRRHSQNASDARPMN